MKIDKITFKNGQAWVVVRSEDDNYIGTWHIVDCELAKQLQKELPNKIKIWKEKE